MDRRPNIGSPSCAGTQIPPPPDPRAMLASHGLLAKKSFGQNFLRDVRIHQRIVAALEISPGDHVVEIGAGLGTLTWYLAHSGARLFAIERDRELAPILREIFEPFGNVEIVEADAKRLRYADYAPAAPRRLRVVGNIPYQLTSPLLFALLDQRREIDSVALLVQREVADRIVEPPGSRMYGLLSVLLGAVADVRRVAVVPRGAFHPSPRVDSAVIAWRFHERHGPFPAELIQVAKTAFQKRRKTLRNALASFGEATEPALRQVGIDPQARPETLSPAQFVELARALGAAAAKASPAR